MSHPDYQELDLAVRRLRRLPHEAGKPGSRPAIDLLLARLEQETEPDGMIDVLNMLSHEYGYEFDGDGNEWSLRKLICLQPHHPYPHTALAAFILYHREDMQEALALARQAVDLATRRGVMMIHSLNVQARIARKVGDWELFASCLKGLMEVFGRHHGPDIGYERDFIRRLPRGAVNKTLLRQYDEFLKRREALRPSDQGDEVHEDLERLQLLRWHVSQSSDYVATAEELQFLERCRQIVGEPEPLNEPIDEANWKQALAIFSSNLGRAVGQLDRLMTAFQQDMKILSKAEAMRRADEAVQQVQGSVFKGMARRAIKLLH